MRLTVRLARLELRPAELKALSAGLVAGDGLLYCTLKVPNWVGATEHTASLPLPQPGGEGLVLPEQPGGAGAMVFESTAGAIEGPPRAIRLAFHAGDPALSQMGDEDGGGLGSAPQVQLPQRGEVEMALGGLGAPLPPAEGDAWSCELDCELGGRGGVVAQAALAIEWLPAVGLEGMRSDIS